jgi:hypothetical protein
MLKKMKKKALAPFALHLFVSFYLCFLTKAQQITVTTTD